MNRVNVVVVPLLAGLAVRVKSADPIGNEIFLTVPAAAAVKLIVNCPDPKVKETSPKKRLLLVIAVFMLFPNSLNEEPVKIDVLPAVTPSLSLSISNVTVLMPSFIAKLVPALIEAVTTTMLAFENVEGVEVLKLGAPLESASNNVVSYLFSLTCLC